MRRVREGLADCSGCPTGYEVVLGNGGTTAFWDIATFGLVREEPQHLAFGEFSSKFAAATRSGAVPRRPDRHRAASPAPHPAPQAEAGVDVYAWPHNETSTGVMPIRRVAGADEGALVAGRRHLRRRRPAGRHPRDRRLLLRAAEVLRLGRRPVAGAVLPRGARAGRARSRRSGRWIPTFFDLPTAIDNSPQGPDLQHAGASPRSFLLAEQVDWFNGQGGLAWARPHGRLVRRGSTAGPRRRRTRRRSSPTRRSARRSWARSTSTTPSTPRRSRRCCAPTGSSTPSPTASSAATSCAIAMFPAVEPADVEALTALHRLRRRAAGLTPSTPWR